MKLIIDIPKDIIESAKSSPNYYPAYHFEKIWRAIANGIPLDKIRAEIEELDRYYDNDYFSGNRDAMYKCSEVLQIIDHYKAESEDKS